jgi:transcriptional antiterminator NusG
VLSTHTSAWYAIRVKSNRERVSAQGLKGKGFEVCFPCYSAKHRDRTPGSRAETPLFPGYIFGRFDPSHRLPVLTVPGVVHIVGFGGVPLPLEEREIIAILGILKSGLPVTPYPVLPVGQLVQLDAGPLAGLCGVILSHLNEATFVVSVTLLQRSVAVQVDRSWIRPARSSAHFIQRSQA